MKKEKLKTPLSYEIICLHPLYVCILYAYHAASLLNELYDMYVYTVQHIYVLTNHNASDKQRPSRRMLVYLCFRRSEPTLFCAQSYSKWKWCEATVGDSRIFVWFVHIFVETYNIQSRRQYIKPLDCEWIHLYYTVIRWGAEVYYTKISEKVRSAYWVPARVYDVFGA